MSSSDSDHADMEVDEKKEVVSHKKADEKVNKEVDKKADSKSEEEENTSESGMSDDCSNPPEEDENDDSDDPDDSNDNEDSGDESQSSDVSKTKMSPPQSESDPKSDDKFEPKEPTKNDWKEHGWDEDELGPPPLMSSLMDKISEFKKGKKNALPDHKELSTLLGRDYDEKKQNKAYRIILGIRNEDDKLDQAGQKGSMRSFYKEQFPKSERSKGPGVSFSVIENEVMLPLEESYVPKLEAAIKKIKERARNCDKGHEPKAKIAAWEKRFLRAKDSLEKRKNQAKEEKEKRMNASKSKIRKRSSSSIDEETKKKVLLSVKEQVHNIMADEGCSYEQAMDMLFTSY